MKISLLTVSYNSAITINDTIESIRSQDYNHIEYIIVDGDSTDGTVEIIKSHDSFISKWISEPDKGIYDAMNKAVLHLVTIFWLKAFTPLFSQNQYLISPKPARLDAPESC